MNKRVKAVRKDQKMTQAEFGNELHLSKNYLSNVETGLYPISDKFIDEVCRTFHVNENWLRTGDGEMYQEMSKEEEIATIAARLYKDDGSEYRKLLIDAILNVPEENLKACVEFFKTVAELSKKKNEQE